MVMLSLELSTPLEINSSVRPKQSVKRCPRASTKYKYASCGSKGWPGGRRSTTATSAPSLARQMAAPSPAGPPPTTSASTKRGGGPLEAAGTSLNADVRVARSAAKATAAAAFITQKLGLPRWTQSLPEVQERPQRRSYALWRRKRRILWRCTRF
eukprot:scaffold6180_cov200-Pinguiococcus_pyrenoidosus.AAC.1